MTPQLMVLFPGAVASIQDPGRFGYRRIGVPQSGVMHPDLMWIANALAGNHKDTAVIEFFLSGPTFRLEEGTVRLALAGDFSMELTRGKAKRTLRSWRSVTLEAGDTLQVGPVVSGTVGYVAISGGLNLTPVMGSCATYLRGGFGGVDGKRLTPNSILEVVQDTPEVVRDAPEVVRESSELKPDCQLPQPPKFTTLGLTQETSEQNIPVTIRVIPGPQDDYFTDAAWHDFLTGSYSVSKESDRMGSRLEGPLLTHHPDKNPEIISDGIVPGAIQVPGNGAPIVLLADGPTVGGYPKIATIISVDLPKLAIMPPGGKIRFEVVTAEEAEALLRTHRREMTALIKTIEPLELTFEVNLQALYNTSLVSGVFDALDMP